jgi:hypothetical protein
MKSEFPFSHMILSRLHYNGVVPLIYSIIPFEARCFAQSSWVANPSPNSLSCRSTSIYMLNPKPSTYLAYYFCFWVSFCFEINPQAFVQE